MRFLKPTPFNENAVRHVGASRARKDAASGASAASFSHFLRRLMSYLSPGTTIAPEDRRIRHAEPLRQFAAESLTFSPTRDGTTNDDSPQVRRNAAAFVSAQARACVGSEVASDYRSPSCMVRRTGVYSEIREGSPAACLDSKVTRDSV